MDANQATDNQLHSAMYWWLVLGADHAGKKRGFFKVEGGEWWTSDRDTTAAAWAERFPRGMPKRKGKSKPKDTDA